MHWFTRDWWRYLLAPRNFYSEAWPTVIWCRLRGHPHPNVWHNIGGTEPDYHCSNCMDDLS